MYNTTGDTDLTHGWKHSAWLSCFICHLTPSFTRTQETYKLTWKLRCHFLHLPWISILGTENLHVFLELISCLGRSYLWDWCNWGAMVLEVDPPRIWRSGTPRTLVGRGAARAVKMQWLTRMEANCSTGCVVVLCGSFTVQELSVEIGG